MLYSLYYNNVEYSLDSNKIFIKLILNRIVALINGVISGPYINSIVYGQLLVENLWYPSKFESYDN